MEIRLLDFCAALQQTQAEKVMDDSIVSNYLLNNLFLPFMAEKDIRLDSLDYNAFTLEELSDLGRYINQIESVCNKTGQIYRNLQKSNPAPGRVKKFC